MPDRTALMAAADMRYRIRMTHAAARICGARMKFTAADQARVHDLGRAVIDLGLPDENCNS